MATTVARMSISFGLVSVPTLVSAATEPRSTGLHYVHASDGARIQQRRYCSSEGIEVPWDQVARGWEAADGRVVVLTDEDLADLPLQVASKTIEVLCFLPGADVDPVLFDKAYYLSPDGRAAARSYILLRDALEESGLVGVARWTLRTRESLALLRVRGDVLVVQSLLWAEEVRPTEGLAPDAPAPTQRERDMARTLLEQLTEEFEWGGLPRHLPACPGGARRSQVG